MKNLRKFIKKIIRKSGYKIVPADQHAETPMTYTNVARLFYLHRLFMLTKEVPGDIVECGVGCGRSFLSLATILRIEGGNKNLWGFDSFQGFPSPSEQDTSPRCPQEGENSFGIKEVYNLLNSHINDDLFVRSKITLVKGFFEDSLKNFKGDAISLLNLDVDLFASYKICLETLFPKLSDGGIVTFDEYVRESFGFPGAMEAINDFFEKKKVKFVKDEYYGKFYVVKRG